MSKRHAFPYGSLVIGVLFVGVMFATWLLVRPPPPPDELRGVLRSELRPLAPFLLSSHRHGPITEKQLRDKWSFVFFGYRSCPDVCPNTLHELGAAWRRLGDERGGEPDNLQVLFVSVDPERDTPEKLAGYVAHFNRDFIGATAGKGQIDRLVRQFGADYRFEPAPANGPPLIAHTSAIFLVDPYGRLVASFSQPHYASTIARQFRLIEEYFASEGVT